MKRLPIIIALLVFQTLESVASYPATWPFAGSVGQGNTTALHMSDNAIVSWADGYENIQYGGFLLPRWKTPAEALGPAEGNALDIVCLGRGGQITLTFAQGISDGSGFDFAVFENAFNDYFLELGWVEVSSDGTNFVRFPNYSYTAQNPDTFFARDIYGLASKYRQGYGSPFDLAELQWASDAIAAGTHSFTNTYVEAFTNHFPAVDLSNVKYVRIIDVVGDGSARDSEGFTIYDPYPTSGSAGFDLDAIAVLNQPAPNGAVQTVAFDPIPHQKLSFGSIELQAVSDSGLSVFFTLQSGPATLAGSTLTFSGTGVVEAVARQGGDASYAPAVPVLRSFHVAEELQHIFIEAVPNQLKGGADVQLKAYAASGLPVEVEVVDGPDNVLVQSNLVLEVGNEVGPVTLRAFQSGNGTYAPASDVFVEFQIVEATASNAPLTLAQWAALHSVPSNGLADSDNDGASDFQEFIMGGDPHNSTNTPVPAIGSAFDLYGQPAMVLEYTIDRSALGRCRILESSDLSIWTNVVPEIVGQTFNADLLQMKVRFPADETNRFYRMEFEEQ